jgi:hypothetical protein
MTDNRDNLAALEHLRQALLIADDLRNGSRNYFSEDIENAIRSELTTMCNGNNLAASTVCEWLHDYPATIEFPWLEKLQRAVDLLDDSKRL